MVSRFRPSPLLVVLLVAFAIFVWPSCYSYHTTDRLHRVHRLTNEAQVWTDSTGWTPRY
jgi:hypothetical protein